MWHYTSQLFAGNYDRNTVVINTLRRPIRSRYFRIYPRQWYRHISMRAELYGLTKGEGKYGPMYVRYTKCQ